MMRHALPRRAGPPGEPPFGPLSRPHSAMPRYEPRLARLAAMIADPARSRMLSYLLDGHYASAGELAEAAGVIASTASGHLAKLEEAQLVVAERRGRHRYFKLADAEVAHALEALAIVAERGAHRKLWDSPARAPLRYARCCYGHLAGHLGVQVMQALERDDRLRTEGDALTLTDRGHAWLASLGLDAGALPRATARQRLAYPCLDWSERRDHLAGMLAARLLEHFIEKGWLRGEHGPLRNRALTLTPKGHTELLPLLER